MTSAQGDWSVVIPYYNEAEYLPATLRSLLAQTHRGATLILVDNGSTDGSGGLARELTATATDISVKHLNEPEPGQVHALAKGIAAVESDFVAICDADTFYPPDYLATADAAFRAAPETVVAVMATGINGAPDRFSASLKRLKVQAVSRLWPRQLHSGGHAHCFRTAALRAVGGYDKALWPYVLKDHELMHRIFKRGRAVYPPALWCRPSDRRSDRSGVRWSLAERLLYHFTPFAAKDWFFYRFLAGRFTERRLDEIKLRQQSWDEKA